MRYAQVEEGQQLHLVYGPGEGPSLDKLTPAGHLGAPLCGRPYPGYYRMTINVPLGHACKNCLRAWRAILKEAENEARTARQRRLTGITSQTGQIVLK
jgi:hypothetical protein